MSLLPSVVVGSRVATRVRIKDGAFAGMRGYVVRIVHPGAILIRLTKSGRQIVLPFGESEIEPVDA